MSQVSMQSNPLDAWWVRQGFDSGILLINKRKCSRELDKMCEMAHAKTGEKIRSISMVRV